MRKILALSLIAVAALVSQAGAAPCLANGNPVFCEWPSGGCWQVNSVGDDGPSTCATQASYCPALFTGGSENSGNCAAGGNTSFTDCVSCYTEDASSVYCDYGPPNQYGCGGCYEASAAKCTEANGTPVPQAQCVLSAATQACELCPGTGAQKGQAYLDGTCGNVPIITLSGAAIGNSLTSMQNAVNVQVASGTTAMLSIYDMKGKAISSQRVWQGSHVVQLQQLPRGLYVVQASNGSWKQTIKITIK